MNTTGRNVHYKQPRHLQNNLPRNGRLIDQDLYNFYLSPEIVEVTAPVPDYPPMLFRYKGKLHKIIKSDGPERIEQEWWIEEW
jgi:protein ImuB